uniref:Uncharacterized protein n=1 Tax=Anguilla anguilla TaxID=7936 RepID=A0A0E9X9A5_ANGAN
MCVLCMTVLTSCQGKLVTCLCKCKQSILLMAFCKCKLVSDVNLPYVLNVNGRSKPKNWSFQNLRHGNIASNYTIIMWWFLSIFFMITMTILFDLLFSG